MALEITQFCMQNETNQGHRIKSLVFKQGTKMHNFCLKQQISVWRSSLKQSLMRVAIVMDCHGIDMKLNPQRTVLVAIA